MDIASILNMIVYILLSLLATKLVFFRKTKEDNSNVVGTWKSALDSLAITETRLQQLQERDLRQQERIWALEDLTRDLQGKLTHATKDLLIALKSQEQPEPDFGADDEE